MKNKTKALVLACLCIFATLMLTACGGKSSSDSADVTVDAKQYARIWKVRLTVKLVKSAAM